MAYDNWPKEGPCEVRRQGTVRARVNTPDEAFVWLLKNQGQSVDWATRYNGYSVVSVPFVTVVTLVMEWEHEGTSEHKLFACQGPELAQQFVRELGWGEEDKVRPSDERWAELEGMLINLGVARPASKRHLFRRPPPDLFAWLKIDHVWLVSKEVGNE